ncbi:dephospho-CoA kinase [Salinicola sp. JS01]|uniref:dephospho-CoA kinase n=1 Tax=Salinicola sp. JS01 TaxID=3050071 RepID=UPI00255B8081|nr:dephospho-CoA kinase [Salinicola sp. JS01]WIX34273.1 dephospho-CoA kinase [Salinicola sp. JS01]
MSDTLQRTPTHQLPPVIGVTGGIGSGKSAVAEAFAARGIPGIDADAVAREVVMPGEPALAAIVEHFGAGVLDADGSLDRRALRARVFADPAERQWLEHQTHPRIRQRLQAHLSRLRGGDAPYCLLISPLLIESGQREMVSRVLVIDVPESLQIERTLARDGVPREQVEAILAAQSSRQARLAAADDVIDNSGDKEMLLDQVARLDERYRQWAASPQRHGHS